MYYEWPQPINYTWCGGTIGLDMGMVLIMAELGDFSASRYSTDARMDHVRISYINTYGLVGKCEVDFGKIWYDIQKDTVEYFVPIQN